VSVMAAANGMVVGAIMASMAGLALRGCPAMGYAVVLARDDNSPA